MTFFGLLFLCMHLFVLQRVIVCAGQGVTVNPMVRDKASGKVQRGPPFKHHIVLMGVYADSKVRIKLANTLSQAAYLGCGYCWMNGVYVDTMRWAGYARPVVCQRGQLGPKPPNVPARSVQIGVDDDIMRLNTATWIARGHHLNGQHAAHQADQKHRQDNKTNNLPPPDGPPVSPPAVEHWGAHRSCVFTDMLWYVNPLLLFLVPFAHTYFRGVLRDFCDEITQQPDSLSGQAAASGAYQTAYVAELERRAQQYQLAAIASQARWELAEAAYQSNPNAANKQLLKEASKDNTAATREAEACQTLFHHTREAVTLTTPRFLRPELALTAAERNEMNARSDLMTDTPDMGRPYTKFLQKKGLWTVEEWRRAQRPWLPLLFADNLCAAVGRPQAVKSRFAAVHTEVFECGEGSFEDKQAKRNAKLQEARQELLMYGKLVETVSDICLYHHLH